MRKVQGNDAFQRINFLYQISKEVAATNPALSSYYGNLVINIAKKNVLKIVDRDLIMNACAIFKALAMAEQPRISYSNREYYEIITAFGEVHPDIKRQICKKCRCMLIDKKSAKKTLETENKQKYILWKCNTCGAKRRFPADKNKDHTIWLEKAEAIVEVIE